MRQFDSLKLPSHKLNEEMLETQFCWTTWYLNDMLPHGSGLILSRQALRLVFRRQYSEGRKSWQRLCACFTMIRWMGIRNPIPGMICPKSTAIRTVRPFQRQKRSISSLAAFLAACQANWACANTSNSNGHTLVVTSDKDGADSVLDRELPDAEIVISQPFWPAYHDGASASPRRRS